MSSLFLNLLGDVEVVYQNDALDLPPSRKTKAILAYLALAPKPVRRERLCELLWDIPDDPKGALRWSLSKIRRLMDVDGQKRVIANRTHASLDLDGVDCDVSRLHALAATEPAQLDSSELAEAIEQLSGDFLEGLDLPNQLEYHNWYLTEREQVRQSQVKLVRALLQRLSPQQALPLARRQLELLPYDPEAHSSLIGLLVLNNNEDEARQQSQQSLKTLGNDYRDLLYRALQTAKPVVEQSSASKTSAAHTGDAPIDKTTVKPTRATTLAFTEESVGPLVAVSPFKSLSSDPEQTYFSDGVTRDILVALSRFRAIQVVAGDFSRSNDDQAQAPEVDYVVEGSVRRAGDTLRISAQLLDGRNGTHIWAESYDRSMQEIFAVQDEISRAISATVGGRLEHYRMRETRRASADDLSVYDLILRAEDQHYRMQKVANEEAKQFLLRALALDAANPRVHSLLGAVEQINYQMCWVPEREAVLLRALEHGKEALRLESEDSLIHARLGDTLMHCRRYNEAKRHFKQALYHNPNDTVALALYAEYLRGTGESEQALQVLDTVQNYDPYDRMWFPWLRGEALFQLDRFDEAVSAFSQQIENINCMILTLAACHARLGEIETATELVQEYIEVAEQEMPEFPGTDYASWRNFRQQQTDSRDQVYKMRMDALAECWP